ncbi:hypothetical protein D3C80_1912540 [compost metagenome]
MDDCNRTGCNKVDKIWEMYGLKKFNCFLINKSIALKLVICSNCIPLLGFFAFSLGKVAWRILNKVFTMDGRYSRALIPNSTIMVARQRAQLEEICAL